MRTCAGCASCGAVVPVAGSFTTAQYAAAADSAICENVPASTPSAPVATPAVSMPATAPAVVATSKSLRSSAAVAGAVPCESA